MSGRTYTVLLEQVNLSTSVAHKMIQLVAPSNASVEIIEAWVTQSNSEVSTQEVVELNRLSATTTQGTVYTPAPMDERDAAAGSSALVNSGSSGSTIDSRAYQEAFNILGKWHYLPPVDSRIVVQPSSAIGLYFFEAPEAAIDVTAGITFREV